MANLPAPTASRRSSLAWLILLNSQIALRMRYYPITISWLI